MTTTASTTTNKGMTMEGLKSHKDLMMKAIKLDFENTELEREIEQYQEQNKAQTLQIIQLLQEIEQLKNPWISVEDRLPEPEREVLIYPEIELSDWHYTASYGWIKPEVKGFYIDYDSNGYASTYLAKHITHWMPIPKLEGQG